MNANAKHRGRGLSLRWIASITCLTALSGPAVSVSWAKQTEKAAQRPGKAAFDLSYVPADAPLVVAVRAGDLLKGDDVKSLVEGIPGYDQFLQAVKLKPESIAQVTYVLNGLDEGAAADGNSPKAVSLGLVILKVSEAQDWDKLASSIVPTWVEEKFSGLTYHKLPAGQGPPIAYHAPDDHTVIIGLEANLFKAMRRGKGKPGDYSWIETWKPVEGYDAAVVVDVGWARSQITAASPQDTGGKLALAGFSPLWEETSSVAIGLRSDAAVSLFAVAACGTEEGAKKLNATAQAILTLSQNGMRAVPALIQEGPEGVREKLNKLLALAESAIDRGRVERVAKTVRLALSAEIKAADLARLILQASGAPVPDAAK